LSFENKKDEGDRAQITEERNKGGYEDRQRERQKVVLTDGLQG